MALDPRAVNVKLGVDPSDVAKGMQVFRGEMARGFKSVESEVKKFRQDLLGVNSAIKTLVAGAVAAFSIRGFGRMITEAARAGDEIGKLSERIGVSTEFLSEMRFVAERNGVQAAKLETAYGKLGAKLADFRERGVGPVAEVMGALSQETRQMILQGESLEDLMPRLADDFKGMTSDQERARVAMKLFEETGIEFVGLLKQGSAGMNELRAEAQRLGASLSREQTQRFAEFEDSVTNLKTAASGLATAISGELVGSLGEANNHLADLLSTIGAGIKGFTQLKEAGVRGIDVLAEALFRAASGTRDTPEEFFGGKPKGGLSDAEKKRIAEFQAADRARQAANAESIRKQEAAALGASTGKILDLKPGSGGGFDFFEALGAPLTAALESATTQTQDWVGSTVEGMRIVGEEARIAAELIASEGFQFVESFRVTTTDILTAVGETITAVTQGVGDAVATAIVDGANLEEALLAVLKNVMKQVISSLVQLALQQVIFLALQITTITARTAAELASWAAVVYAAAFAASASAGLVGLALAPAVAKTAVVGMLAGAKTSGALGKTVGASVALAEGGIVTGPTHALIGEAGPEAVIPLSSPNGLTSQVNIYLDSRMIAQRMISAIPGVVNIHARGA